MRVVPGLVCVLGLTACVGGGGKTGSGGAGSGDDGGSAYVGGSAGTTTSGHAAVGGSSGAAPGTGDSGGTLSSGAGTGGVGGAGASGSAGTATAGSSGGSTAAGSGGTPAASMPAAGARDSHFPLLGGAQWTYHHSGGSKAAWDETDTMDAGTYQGKPAFIFADQEDAQGAQTRSTLVVDGTGVYRAYKDIRVSGQTVLTVSYAPAFLRYDEAWQTAQQQVTLDDAWVQTCVISSVVKTCAPGAVKTGTTTHEYTVMSTSAAVTVPAGTFTTVQIKRVDPNTGETKLYWFARGVGKVRDEAPATGEITELTAYTLP